MASDAALSRLLRAIFRERKRIAQARAAKSSHLGHEINVLK
jgi:hypothetical protein